MNWSDQNVETACKLWKDGLSARQIAQELGQGATRNAVIGKLARLGLSGSSGGINNRRVSRSQVRPYRANQQKSEKAKVRAAQAPRKNGAFARSQAPQICPHPYTERAPDIIPQVRRIRLSDVTSSTCHYILGDPLQSDGAFYCGADVFEKPDKSFSPYCEAHHRLCYVPTNMKHTGWRASK